MPSKPFQTLPFDSLPEQPRLPHAYHQAKHERITLQSPHFGTLGIKVASYGEGPPLVCIHGLMTASYSFRYVMEPLGRHFRVIAPDLPGAGESDKPDVSYDAGAMADFLGLFLKTIGAWGSPVLGNSMGGYLCMRLAMREPLAMSRLLNMHSPGLPTARMVALEMALRIPGSVALLNWLVRRNPQRWAHRNVHYFDETLKSLEEARIYGAPLATPEGRRSFAAHLRETLQASQMRAWEADLKALQGRFPIPLMLLYAKKDPMVPPIIGSRLASLLPSASLVWLEHGSHFAHVDAPDLFLEAALPFLRDR